MRKILVVSEHSSGFYRKYITNLLNSLQDKDEVILMLGGDNDLKITVPLIKNKEFSFLSSNYDEHRFIEVFNEAKKNNITHIHFCRILDPQRLYIAIETANLNSTFTISFGVFGIAEYTRRPIYARYVEKLLERDIINSVLIHSIGPETTEQLCSEMGYYQSKKISFIHDPIYENPNDYNLDSTDAKNLLNLEKKGKIILFFGSYFYSKGPDLLLSVAEELIHLTDLNFIFIGDTKTASFDFRKEDYSKLKNVTFIDKFVKDHVAINYMIASDIVVLPYRKYYENDTSGVFVQSCLAKTPLLVPDISPFKNVIENFQLGSTFNCESVESLKQEIINFYNSNNEPSNINYSNYIKTLTSWSDIAKLI